MSGLIGFDSKAPEPYQFKYGLAKTGYNRPSEPFPTKAPDTTNMIDLTKIGHQLI